MLYKENNIYIGAYSTVASISPFQGEELDSISSMRINLFLPWE